MVYGLAMKNLDAIVNSKLMQAEEFRSRWHDLSKEFERRWQSTLSALAQQSKQRVRNAANECEHIFEDLRKSNVENLGGTGSGAQTITKERQGTVDEHYEALKAEQQVRDAIIKLNNQRIAMEERFSVAFGQLIAEIWRPCITFATTGTTSSGKSTLVNLLCGAAIMPVDIEEMSAGVVEITHGTRKSLKIHPTPGALWEHGEWEDPTDQQISDLLRQAMAKYHEHVYHVRQLASRSEVGLSMSEANTQFEEFKSIACPRAELTYPTRLGNEHDLLKLPPQCGLKIVDLPGLKHVHDEINRPVIEEARRAVCLVTYNSEEPNEQVQNRLLEQIADQVKAIGGSPARMLFILNRIDGVGRDYTDGGERQQRFIEKKAGQIREILGERLPQYQYVTNSVAVLPLSTLPALRSLQMMNGDASERTEAWKQIRGRFAYLLGEEVMDELKPLNQWTEGDFHTVAKLMWKTSRAEAFFEALKQHVANHFPELVLPQAIDRFKMSVASDLVEWAVQTAQAELNSSTERFERERKRIDDISVKLREIIQSNEQSLLAPINKLISQLEQQKRRLALEGDGGSQNKLDPSLVIRNGLQELQKHPVLQSLPKNTLAPLWIWRDNIAFASRTVLEGIAWRLQGEEDRLEIAEERMSPRFLVFVKQGCRALINAGYSVEMATSRPTYHFVTQSEIERDRLRQINSALNDMADILKTVMEDTVERAAKLEIAGITEAMHAMLNAYRTHVASLAIAVAPDIGLVPPPGSFQLLKEEAPQIRYSFKAGFVVQTEVVTQQEGTKKVATGKRAWWNPMYWLDGETIYSEAPNFVQRDEYHAHIPGAESLQENWEGQVKLCEPELVDQVVEWMKRQIEHVSKEMITFQENLIRRYQTRLDEAHAKASLVYGMEQHDWSIVLKDARELADTLESMKQLVEPEETSSKAK
jgi:predicted GTPase